jgi:hypothetical protein
MRCFPLEFRAYGAGPAFLRVSSYKDLTPTKPFFKTLPAVFDTAIASL